MNFANRKHREICALVCVCVVAFGSGDTKARGNDDAPVCKL